ncbi:MAG: hypothetical protein AAF193_02215 [Bacteroidota bacterium]
MKKQEKKLAALASRVQRIEESTEGILSGGFSAVGSNASGASTFARFANTNNATGCVCSGSGSNTNQVVACSCSDK